MDSFWANIFKRKSDQQGTRQLLREIPLFARLSNRELDAIEAILYRRRYRAGETIFRQGEPGVGMYIVAEGVVSIIYEPTSNVLTELKHGDFFGEIALLNETPRSATAQAKTACTLLGFFQPELLDMLDRNPRLAVKVLLPLAQIAGQRLIDADKKLLRMHEALHQAEASHQASASAETETSRSALDELSSLTLD